MKTKTDNDKKNRLPKSLVYGQEIRQSSTIEKRQITSSRFT